MGLHTTRDTPDYSFHMVETHATSAPSSHSLNKPIHRSHVYTCSRLHKAGPQPYIQRSRKRLTSKSGPLHMVTKATLSPICRSAAKAPTALGETSRVETWLDKYHKEKSARAARLQGFISSSEGFRLFNFFIHEICFTNACWMQRLLGTKKQW